MSTYNKPAAPPPTHNPVFRFLSIALMIVGGLAVALFLLSLVLSEDTSELLRRIASMLGIVCAILGLSLAFVVRRSS